MTAIKWQYSDMATKLKTGEEMKTGKAGWTVAILFSAAILGVAIVTAGRPEFYAWVPYLVILALWIVVFLFRKRKNPN